MRIMSSVFRSKTSCPQYISGGQRNIPTAKGMTTQDKSKFGSTSIKRGRNSPPTQTQKHHRSHFAAAAARGAAKHSATHLRNHCQQAALESMLNSDTKEEKPGSAIVVSVSHTRKTQKSLVMPAAASANTNDIWAGARAPDDAGAKQQR